MKKKDIYGYISLLVACGIIALIALQRQKNLTYNFLVSTGHVVNVETFPQGGDVFVEYYFIVDGVKYKHKSSILHSGPFFSKTFKFLIGKNLVVVYEKGNPNNSEMLFLSKDYEKYKVPISEESVQIVNKIDNIVNER